MSDTGVAADWVDERGRPVDETGEMLIPRYGQGSTPYLTFFEAHDDVMQRLAAGQLDAAGLPAAITRLQGLAAPIEDAGERAHAAQQIGRLHDLADSSVSTGPQDAGYVDAMRAFDHACESGGSVAERLARIDEAVAVMQRAARRLPADVADGVRRQADGLLRVAETIRATLASGLGSVSTVSTVDAVCEPVGAQPDVVVAEA